ncbi:MAG: rubrerythrin family protein [Mycobacteriales bacterium]
MPRLAGSETHDNLKEAFAGESMANRRYLFFARQAEIEGHGEYKQLFEDTAAGETGHAFGHLEYLRDAGDPATGEPIGDTYKNLASAVAGETYEFTAMYPGFAKTAREEGFDEIADWFSTLARAEKTHAGRFQKALDGLRSGQAATTA